MSPLYIFLLQENIKNLLQYKQGKIIIINPEFMLLEYDVYSYPSRYFNLVTFLFAFTSKMVSYVIC